MLEIEDLKNIYPLVVTPSHDGKYFHNYVISLLNFQNYATKNWYAYSILFNVW